MDKLYSTTVITDHGCKSMEVYCASVLDFPEDIDILTTSAFHRSYAPTPNTLFKALKDVGISVQGLSKDPLIDLRGLCNVWLSDEIKGSCARIGRIGCIEMRPGLLIDLEMKATQKAMLNSITAYFQMLDIAATYNVKMDTVALPLLGAGSQKISANLTIIPIINECIAFLKRNALVKRICFIEINPANAYVISGALNASYTLIQKNQEAMAPRPTATADRLAFISYSTPDKNIADNLCFKLEQKGIRVWYAPRDVKGDYASSIANAISTATHFVVIISENSMKSEHVLNEVDLAFQQLPKNIRFKPLKIDQTGFAPAFAYYLSRQHWMDAHLPPLEARLDEFVRSFDE